MATVKFEVAEGVASWGYDGEAYAAGERHEVEDPNPDLGGALLAAHHAGAVRVLEGIRSLPPDAVETDRQSLTFKEKVETLTADHVQRRNEIEAELLQNREEAISAGADPEEERKVFDAALKEMGADLQREIDAAVAVARKER